MFAIVFISFIAGISGYLTTLPENAAVIAGVIVVMKCRTNDTDKTILWRAPMSANHSFKIFDGERISNEWSGICYKNNSHPGQYDLIINSTTLAGTQYVCQEGPFGHLNDNMGNAELIVLEADPNCYMKRQFKDEKGTYFNETNVSFEMCCTVRYSGNWTPMMEWRQDGRQEPIYTGVNTTVQNGTVISKLTVSANVTNNLTQYICTTRFDKRDKPSSTTADNVPNYSHNWTSPIIFYKNENPATTSSSSKTETSSQLTQNVIIVIAVLQGVLLVILLLFLFRQRIQKKTRSSNHDLHVVREADILQHTAHGTSEEPDFGIGRYDAIPPAYATVSHHTTERNAITSGQYAHYSMVKNTEPSDTVQGDNVCETPQRSSYLAERYPGIGADGTKYTEMATMISTNCSQQQKPTKTLLKVSNYAEIDHTAKVPPPPPQSVKFLR